LLDEFLRQERRHEGERPIFPRTLAEVIAEPAARRGRFDPLQSEQKHQHQRQPNSPGNHGSRAEIRTGIAHAAELLRE
jgi:hypothetical protein